MASLFPGREIGRDYAHRISSHLAGALFIFALFQIFVVAQAGGSLAMHFGIIIAVGGFALAARNMERRWARLSHGGLPDAMLATRFRTDLIQLWGATLLAPLLWIPVGVVGRFLFG